MSMSISPAIKNNLLTLAAGLTGFAIPALIMGRAVLGIALGLGVLIALVCANWREVHGEFMDILTTPLAYLIYAAMLGTSINVFFSLRIDLSGEAWARTYVLFGLCAFLTLALKDRLLMVMGSLSLLSSLFLVLCLVGVFSPNKAFMNGLTLALPIFFVWGHAQKNRAWMTIPVLNLLLILFISFQTSAKAAVLGIGLMLFVAIFLASFRYLKASTAFALLVILSLPAIYVIGWWIPQNMSSDGGINPDLLPFPGTLIDAHRQLIWLFSLDLFTQSPWVGFGLNASNYHSDATLSVASFFGPDYSNLYLISEAQVLPGHPHSWIIEILVDSGIIGAVPFIIAVCATLYLSLRQFFQHRDHVSLALCCVHVGFWGTGLINFSFWSVWWQVIYMICALTAYRFSVELRTTAHEHP